MTSKPPASGPPMPGTVTVTRFPVRYSGIVRDFYRATLPGITPGIGPSAELAVTDVLRNYAAACEETDETGRTELRRLCP